MTPARAIALALRTGHLAAMAMLVGAVEFVGTEAAIRPWRLWTVATGAGLLVTEALHSRHWPYEVRGVATLAHVASLALLFVSAGTRAWAPWVAIVVGAAGSHLPKRARRYSLRHRRVLDS